MSARLRYRVALLLSAIATILTVASTQHGFVSLADGGVHYCPAGTHWDNSIQACR